MDGTNSRIQTYFITNSTYSLWVGPGGMLHAMVSSMHAHVLEGGGVIVGLARDAHHSRLGHWLREEGGLDRIWRHILRRPENANASIN